MTPTNREAQQWDQVRTQAAARKLAKDRQEAVAAYVQQRHPTTPAAPENPSTNSLTPHTADGAGLGFRQGRLW